MINTWQRRYAGPTRKREKKTAMTRLEDFAVLLMLDPRTGDVFPFSAHGFEVGTGRFDNLKSRSEGLLFLDESGAVRELTAVRREGQGPLARLRSAFGWGYPITVSLTKTETDLDTLQDMIMTGIKRYKDSFADDDDETWSLVRLPLAEIEKTIRGAENARLLYMKLDLPEPVDCLDLL